MFTYVKGYLCDRAHLSQDYDLIEFYCSRLVAVSTSKKPELSGKRSSAVCRMTRSNVKKSLAIMVNVDWCKGCGFCVAFCPASVLEPSPSVNMKGAHFPVVVSPDDCTVCRRCEHTCPDLSIYLVDQDAPPGPVLSSTRPKIKINSSNAGDIDE